MNAPRIHADRLTGFATAVLTAVGVPAFDAQLVADSLVRADLWGHQSHGESRVTSAILSGAPQVGHGC